MAKERQVIKGIVLRSADTKEADKVLTVLTGPLGKIPVVAKGARGRRSRVTAATQLLSYSEMTLSESHGWQILSEASPIALFDGLRRDIALLSLGSYFAQLADAVTDEGVEAGEILSHLLNGLYALSSLNRPQTLVKAAFELKLMELCGFAPLLDGCASCGREEPEEPMLDIAGGVLRCRSCPGGSGLSLPLRPGVLAAMRYILYGDPRRLYSFALPGEELQQLGQAAEAYTAARMEREFSALTFYRTLEGGR